MINEIVTDDYISKMKDPVFVKTGMKFLDDLLGGGLMTGSLLMIQAPSGVGKTSFLMNLAMQAMKQNRKVFYLSAGEQDFDEILERFTAIFADKSFMTFKNLDKEWRDERIRQFVKKYGELLDIAFSEDPMATIGQTNQLYDYFVKAKNEQCILFIYDYIGSTPAPSEDAEYSYLGQLAGRLKNLANDNGMIVATAMQTNRSLLGELKNFKENETPFFNEAFTSKSVIVPQKCTCCLTLFRVDNSYYLDLFKNRQNGRTVRSKIKIDSNTFNITEIPFSIN